MLSDPERRIIKLYGVLHPEQNIARPSVFIVDEKGIVRHRYIGKDYTDRPSIQSLLMVLRWL